MNRLKTIKVLLLLLPVLLRAGAAAEGTGIRSSPVLNHAFTVLEEGNPFTERYNRLTGGNVRARMAQGAPYFWGAQADHLFAKEPEYVVIRAWSNSPAYYRKGKNYIYGFDCVGFVKWVWKETYGGTMANRAYMYEDREHQVRNRSAGESPLWESAAEELVPGDLLLIEHGVDSHHMAMYAGTLRMYGYTAEEVPELAEKLDEPLVIHCTTNAQIADRFTELIAHGLPKYHCATTTDGGVCVSLMVADCSGVPGYVHQQNQDTRYYTLPDGTWLTVLPCDNVTDYCWYRPAPETVGPGASDPTEEEETK